MYQARPAVQALSRGALLVCRTIGLSSVNYNAGIRLPMVAGWDHLVPGWLSRLYPRHKTPTGSVILVCAGSAAFTILGNLGVGSYEAVQLFTNGSLIFYSTAYLAMFAIPVIARGEKPSFGSGSLQSLAEMTLRADRSMGRRYIN